MKPYLVENRDTVLPDWIWPGRETLSKRLASVADTRVLPQTRGEPLKLDYSEEAIPERDPAYRIPQGTTHDAQTVDALSPAMRCVLARRLEQLGMNTTKATLVAALA